ncbi:MAG TPA: hypothetical protein VE954_43100 [Oligoflexus sp.]|nr:hypothetical protein [Oligoflexus sp.]HYX39932.1 hypothetical protein [Oligoflexus sp.]
MSKRYTLLIIMLFGAIAAESAKVSTCVTIIDTVLKTLPHLQKTAE